tara:strand:- start:9317 stop:10132 length:816 start_codon:yes stop_codon:yes gene_type:complete
LSKAKKQALLIFKMKLLKLILILIIISFFLSFLNYINWLNAPKSWFFTALSPFQKSFYFIARKVSGFFRTIGSISKINQENNYLQKENQELLNKLILQEQIRQENQALHKQLNLIYETEKKHKLVFANIISQGDIYMIDKGALHGLQSNMTVIAPGNILIGKIVEVMNNTSKFLPIMNFSDNTQVLILPSRTKAYVRQKHETSLVLDFILEKEKVELNNLIITSQLSDFQPGLIIGKISKLEKTDNQLEQKAIINTLVNIKTLEKVFIILK